MDNYNTEDDWRNFKSSILHFNNSRVHKIRHSLGVYDAYKWIRKNNWLNIGRLLTEHEFYSIIRGVNKYLADNFLEGYDIKFPNRMGQLELKKYDAKFKLVNNKVKTNLPVDWDRTLKLWYEDKDAYDKKILIKVEEKEIFKVSYNKHKANYNNKGFYEFKVNRELKKSIKQKLKEGELDAFKI